MTTQLRVAPGCQRCEWLKPCGGRPAVDLFPIDCMEAYCCGGKSDCNKVCPKHPKWEKFQDEVGGLNPDRPFRLVQRPTDLPAYVPLIQHASGRVVPLSEPAVMAVKLERAVGREVLAAGSPDQFLRDKSKVSSSAGLIFSGVTRDGPIENLWRRHRVEGLVEHIAGLRPSLVVAPNFSHFTDVPRFDNMHNRLRQLVFSEALSDAGVNVAPHLSAVYPSDWDYWAAHVRANPSVVYVALEFGTGGKTKGKALQMIRRLVELRERAGRQLHLIAISAGKWRGRLLNGWGGGITFLDSRPFMTAANRKRFVMVEGRARWHDSPTAPHEPIDALLRHNVTLYGDYITARVAAARL